MGSPERILLTSDTVGGVWTFAVDLTRGLLRRGKQVALATMGAALRPSQRAELERTPGITVFESVYKLEWMNEPWEDVARAGEWLLGLERRFAPDVIHLNQYAHGALPFRAPRVITGHSCVLSWWNGVHRQEAPAEWDRYRAEVTRGLRGAALVTAPTEAMLAALERHYGALPHKAVVPNGREWANARSVRKHPWIFTSGRLWDDAKNLAALEAIAPELPWPVFVAGDHRHPDGGVRPCAGCRFLGTQAARQMAWWMDRASIYALPARYEPFGLSILEAALAGCALVLGDIASLREVWGNSARFVPPDDRAALHRELRSLIDDPEIRLEIARDCRHRALQFSASRMVDGYLSAYANVARPSAGQALRHSQIRD